MRKDIGPPPAFVTRIKRGIGGMKEAGFGIYKEGDGSALLHKRAAPPFNPCPFCACPVRYEERNVAMIGERVVDKEYRYHLYCTNARCPYKQHIVADYLEQLVLVWNWLKPIGTPEEFAEKNRPFTDEPERVSRKRGEAMPLWRRSTGHGTRG
jgi:hypothetical protein